MEDYELYLKKIAKTGCGYVAMINTIFKKFEGREKEFQETFGFPMYEIASYGKIRTFNYEYLVLDYFNYIWGNCGYTIQELYSNPSSNDEDSNNEIKGVDTRSYYGTYDMFEDMLREKYNYDVHIRFLGQNEIVKPYGKLNKDTALDIYNSLKTDNNQIVFGGTGYDLYNMDGSLYQTNGGGHAMCITGVTEDGNFIVSSWGKQYILGLDGFAPGFDTEKKGISFEIVEYAN